MRTLYIDCSMGAAGDMLAAALYELVDDKKKFIRTVNSLGLKNVAIRAERCLRSSVSGTRMHVDIDGLEEDEHEAVPCHEHHSLSEIEALVGGLSGISDKVKSNVMGVYRLIAQAEAEVHGVEASIVHFHEVGSLDAIADITAVCLLIEMLSPDKICASPVNLGSGQVRCAHGVMPVPAPATALLLKGIPSFGSDIRTELCTPTGAALLRFFVNEFGSMPEMEIGSVGYGFGKKEFPTQLNAVRAILGITGKSGTQVIELVCNLDDMTPEDIAFASEQLMAHGALDAWITNIGMKKGRPGIMLSCLCREAEEQTFVDCIFKYTTTLGMRKYKPERHIMNRYTRVKDTELGSVRIKHGVYGDLETSKPEYEDIAEIAKKNGKNLTQVRTELSAASEKE